MPLDSWCKLVYNEHLWKSSVCLSSSQLAPLQSIKIKNYDNEPNRTKKSFPLVGRPVQSRAKIRTRGLYDTLKNVCHRVGALPRLARQAAVGEAFKKRKAL